MLSKDAAVTLAKDILIPALTQQRRQVEALDGWYRYDPEAFPLSQKATKEHRDLAELAKTPWLGLVVTNVSQSMYVDGYRSPVDESDTEASPWAIWHANDLDGRQVAIHRAMLAYGSAYGLALPGVDQMTGEPMPRLRGVSPRRMLAFYNDPAEDDYPHVAIRAEVSRGSNVYRIYDEDAVHYLGEEVDGLRYIDYRTHDIGVCPVVRFCNQLDLDGRTPGEVEPFIPVAKRVNKTTYDRLLTQHFNSWKVRTVTGMEEIEDEDAEAARMLVLRQGDLLMSDNPDTKFGTLPESPLDGLIKSEEQAIKTLAAVSQTPVHAMVGDLINLSAEALAAARSTLDAKVSERQKPTGKTWDRFLRLGAHIAGDEAAAIDVSAHVTWADTSIRSLAEAADALGKMATMLGVPPRALWGRIPGVTKGDLEEWKALASSDDPIDLLIREMAAGQTSPAQ